MCGGSIFGHELMELRVNIFVAERVASATVAKVLMLTAAIQNAGISGAGQLEHEV
jgi:hypothetical protein